jgi:hypothetical protein
MKVYVVRVLGGLLSSSLRFPDCQSVELTHQADANGLSGEARVRFLRCCFLTLAAAENAAICNLADGAEYEICEACEFTGDVDPDYWTTANDAYGDTFAVSSIANCQESDLTGSLWLPGVDLEEFRPAYAVRSALRRQGRAGADVYAHLSELRASRDHFGCADCSNWFPSDTATSNPDGDRICEDCYSSAGYFCCESCGHVRDEDNYGRDGVCCSCDEDNEEDGGDECGNVVSSYSKRIAFRPTLRDSDRFLLGLELEVVGSGQASKVRDILGNTDYILKSDGSLPTAGFEIVSQAMGLDVHRDKMSAFLASPPDRLRSFKYDECGLHVHIGREELGADGESRLKASRRIAGFVCRKSNRALIVKLGQRNLNHYCQADGVVMKDYYTKKPVCESSRYSAVNLCNSHTVELRFFKGNLRAAAVWRALEFADAIATWASRKDVSHSEAMDGKAFADFVISRADGRWDHLAAFLASFYSKQLATAEAGV